MSSPLNDAWGDFLSQYRWDWFVTLTFEGDVKSFTAHRRCERWLRDLERAAGMPIFWFRADEYGELNGKFHMHLLVGNVAHLGRFAWMNRWQKHNGFARNFPYDPAKGASFYVAKYVTKQLGDYELSDNADAFRVQQPSLKLFGQRVNAVPEELPNEFPKGFLGRSPKTIPNAVQLPMADFREPDLNEFDPDPIRNSFREQTTLRRK
jgi:hypothetical protein